MNRRRRQRLGLIVCAMLLLSAAAGLLLYALRQNINLFYTPTEVHAGKAPKTSSFRVGGMVIKGSVKRDPNTLQVTFVLSDFKNNLRVVYHGILPDLFREGQGIVAQGKLSTSGQFVATQVLAKHDENYMPPEVAQMLPKTSERRHAS